MSDVTTQDPAPVTLKSALAWLDRASGPDALAELAPLRQQVRILLEDKISPLQRLDLIERFRPRAAAVAAAARPSLHYAQLPLPRPLRSLAKALSDVEHILGTACLALARGGLPGDGSDMPTRRRRLCPWAIDHLSTQLEVALLTSAPVPPGLWTNAQAIYHLAHSGVPLEGEGWPETIETDRTLKRMLAMAATQPEAYASNQIEVLLRFVDYHADKVEISLLSPENSTAWYWLESNRDLPPVAMRRRRPASEDNCLYFAGVALGRIAGEWADRLAATETPLQLGLGNDLAADDCAALLRQVQPHWSNPPKRLLTRRRNNYRVEVCVNFQALWGQLHGDWEAEAPETAYTSSNWMVINESSGGYAIMNMSGNIPGIRSGDALGLRTTAEQPWAVCLVRWARSDNPEHIELGLEVIAPSAEAVQLVGRRSESPQPALLLPSLTRLDRGESLLAPQGGYSHSGFTLIQDSDGHVRIAYCLPGNLLLQTSCVEIYEFERDPLPL